MLLPVTDTDIRVS